MMEEKAEIALLSSILGKWENILNGCGKDEATLNCPLCKEYILKDCRGCPIYKKTGRPFCVGTPYKAWGESIEANTNNVENALAMQEFLISLLPQEDIDNLEDIYINFIQSIRKETKE